MPVVRTGIDPHMPIIVTASGGQFVTWALRLPGQFVAPGQRLPMHYRFFTFWPRGLTPGPKFTKKGEDLLATQLHHSTKFHHPALTHARDIPYKNILWTDT